MKFKALAILVLLLVISPFLVFGQKAGPFTSFLKKFKPTTLPICVDYSHQEQIYFGAIYHTDTIYADDAGSTEFELVDVMVESGNYEKDTTLLLTQAAVKKYLLPNSAHIFTINPESGDTLYSTPVGEYLNSDFYAISRVLNTNRYYGVIYERIFYVSGIKSSEKYFCTISKQGNFISRIRIASFVYSGTGIGSSGVRVPWFPHQQGCIKKNSTIAFPSDYNQETLYKISADGSIVKTKI